MTLVEPVPTNGEPALSPPPEDAAPQEEIATLRVEVQAQATRLQDLQGQVERLERELGLALQRYRQAILDAAPDLPPELLVGETVSELDASVARARALVERVRSQLEADLAHGRVPAGAPPRRTPDLSALSAREKITLGLDRR
ncbi:MAG: hypothetical protein HY688_03765 [Chloroflexi bacterium]|nr:hypothetical protein [Chloroflexota bacterium]